MTAAKPDHEFVPYELADLLDPDAPCAAWVNIPPGVRCGLPRSAHAPRVPCAICEEACEVAVSLAKADDQRTDHAADFIGHGAAYRIRAAIRAACTHATPPRSELADQLEALLREANLKLPLKLVPGEFEHSGHPEEGPCDSDCYWVSPPGVNEIFTEDLGEYHGLSMASAALIVALVNALPEILTALRRTR